MDNSSASRQKLGELTVDYFKVSCDGSACPDPNTFVPVIRLSGASQLGGVILAPLIEGFARARNLSFERQDNGPGFIG